MVVLKNAGLGFEESDARRLDFAYASRENLRASGRSVCTGVRTNFSKVVKKRVIE